MYEKEPLGLPVSAPKLVQSRQGRNDGPVAEDVDVVVVGDNGRIVEALARKVLAKLTLAF
jgi:hypothetical protein